MPASHAPSIGHRITSENECALVLYSSIDRSGNNKVSSQSRYCFRILPGGRRRIQSRAVRCLDPSAIPVLESGIRPKKRPVKKKAKSTNSPEKMVMKERRKRKINDGARKKHADEPRGATSSHVSSLLIAMMEQLHAEAGRRESSPWEKLLRPSNCNIIPFTLFESSTLGTTFSPTPRSHQKPHTGVQKRKG